MSGGIDTGRFDVALVQTQQTSGAHPAYFGFVSRLGEIAEKAVGLLNSVGQIVLVAEPLQLPESSLGPAFPFGVSSLLETISKRTPVAVHVMFGEVAVEALQFLPNSLGIGVRVGGVPAQLSQS